jgi:hypothetical protein
MSGLWLLIAGRKNNNPNFLFFFTILIFDALGFLIGSNFFGHYLLQTLPAISLIAASGYAYFSRPSRLKQILYFTLVAAILFQSFSTTKQLYKKYYLKIPDRNKLTGLYLKQNTKPNDLIYVQGNKSAISFHANRPIACQYEWDLHIYKKGLEEINKQAAVIKANKPKYIVITNENNQFAWLPEYLSAEYFLEETISDYKIYRRKL